MRMSDYLIINDNPKDANHGTVLISGATPLDAINRFDRMLRENKKQYVSHVFEDALKEWTFTVHGLDKDSIGFSQYIMVVKE